MRVGEVKYLGVMINSSLKTTIDVKRQLVISIHGLTC